MATRANEITAPSLALLLAEPGRAAMEFGLLLPGLPWLRAAPRGDGHPVMVLPGMAASDASTAALRAFLKDRAYAVYGWGHGRNTGAESLMRPLCERLSSLHRRHSAKVSLVGWSLGGIYARELAKRVPQEVRSVITLGSPFRGPGRASNVWRIDELLSGKRVGEDEADRFAAPPPVPTTAIYSRSDGIVAWRRCVETPGERRENIEVSGSHSGLGHNPLVLYTIAERLAQSENGWRPFKPQGAVRYLYPRSPREPA